MKTLLLLALAFAIAFSEDFNYRDVVAAKNSNLDVQISNVGERDARSCPSSCSGHGSCVNNNCQCDPGYVGSDCSISLTTLVSGQPVSGSVDTFGWKYYSFQVTAGGHDVYFYINQTGTGDCDEYVQANTYPTRSTYFKRDISTDAFVKINLTNAATGTWYVGVYGFQSCSYSIQAVLAGTCPNGCSGHGSCINSQCRCYTGYGGVDCSQPVVSLTAGTVVSGSASQSQWKYYSYAFNSGNQMIYSLQQTSAGGDCDLYLKLGAIPTVVVWDYANVTTKNTSVINVVDPQVGLWYLGVFGFSPCSYNISVSTGVSCPNNCSGRGTCNVGGTCSCPSGYSGPYCQTRTSPLTNFVSDTGYVSYNNWNYYTYVTNTADNLDINIQQQISSSNADCDLYVKAGSQPTRYSYDYQDLSLATNFTLSINDPGQTTWYIGVYGWAQCTYTITTYESTDCPDNCNNNGQCVNGACSCNPGWAGDACESQVNVVGEGMTVNGTITYNQWLYYSFAVDSPAFYVLLKETSSTGKLWLYVARTNPTISQYLFSDTSNTNLHVISAEGNVPTSQTYQIGVYANPYTLPGQSVNFQLAAWSPNF